MFCPGGVCPGGVCLGVSVQEDVCLGGVYPRVSASIGRGCLPGGVVSAQGVSTQGDVCFRRGVYPEGGFAQGVSTQGDVHLHSPVDRQT